MSKKIILVLLCCLLFPLREIRAAINMAVIAPRAGELKNFGDELVNGVQIAVDDINREGGVHNQRINLIVVDDRCSDTFAVSTAQMMAVNSSAIDKVDVVIGPYCNNEFSQVADIYAQAGIFQIIPTSLGQEEAAHNHSGLVKIVGRQEQQGKDFYQYYAQNFDGTYVALVYDAQNKNIVEIAAAVQKAFLGRGKSKYLRSYSFANYEDNLPQLAADVVNEQNQMAFILGSAKKIAKLSREIKKENRNVAIFANRYQAQASYRQVMGDWAEGSYMIALPSLKNSPNFTETLVRLRLQGAEPEGLGVYGYSAVELWKNLVKKSGSFKYGDLAKALNGHRFETAWGETLFTNGNPDKSVNYGIYQLQNGEYTQVY